MEALMKDIIKSEPLAASVYFNTFDTLNIMYPYIDSLSAFPYDVSVTDYNFYYEADRNYNPNRTTQWTEAYLDPAGRGWITSVIAPIYKGDFLEGVVGIDVTVETIINQILNLNVPWDGYGILVDENGMILALPEKGQGDWGLEELTSYDYSQAVYESVIKPEEFNILKKEELSGFTWDLLTNKSGTTNLLLNQTEQLSAWSTIPETGWKLILFAPEENIYAESNQLHEALMQIGRALTIVLLILFVIFLMVVLKTANLVSRKVSTPLGDINQIAERIGNGEYKHEFPDYKVNEFNETASYISRMGSLVGKAQEVLNNQLDSFMDVNLDMLCVIDWEGKFLKVNRRFEEVLGYQATDIVGGNFTRFIHKDDIKKTLSVIQELRDGKEIFGFINRYINKDGTIIHMEWNAKPGTGEFYFASVRDISQVILREKQLSDLLIRDKLTGQYNRHFFDSMIRGAMEHADRHNVPMSILLFDVDFFKTMNDTFGHQVGDDILIAVARVVRASMRESDLLFRLGGDEFLVLMQHTSLDGAMVAAEKLRAAIEEQDWPIVGRMTISIGVSERMRSESFRHWFRRTDESLYRAKQQSRNAVAASDGNEKLPMTSFHTEWRKDWNSGHDLIDRQHKELFETGKRLFQAYLEGAKFNNMQEILEQLLAQTVTHFKEEEEILHALEYPEADLHGEIHRQLYDKTEWLKRLFEKGEVRAAAFCSYIIDDLILQHIMEDDLKFYHFTGM